MKRQSTLAFKVIAGITCFVGFLTISSEFSRSQSEKPEIRPAWNPEKQILLATAVPVPSRPLRLGVPEVVAKETEKVIKERKRERIETQLSVTKPATAKKISTQEITSSIPKVIEPAKRGVERASLSPPALLTHRELQAMVNYLDYEIFPGRGVRFRYDELRYERMGHEWFLKRPRDLRGKTIRIDYRGYVPRKMTFKLSRSGTSAAVVKKVKLEDSPFERKSIFIKIPQTIPFRDVRLLEFWIDRESVGRSHGDFLIEKVVVLEGRKPGKQVANESRPEPFSFDRPFVPTNLMREEVHAS